MWKKLTKWNIRVVVDGVFNHTGREFFAFQDIRKTENSLSTAVGTRESILGGIRLIMMDLAMRHGETVFELVNLNLREPKVREYLLDVSASGSTSLILTESALTARTVWSFPLWKK